AFGEGERDPQEVPLLRDRGPIDGKAAAYVCVGFTCNRPATEVAELEGQLRGPQSQDGTP
ncbi:MAG TPA: hypothetical protein VM537_23460, partial [Anaerolineae bacterium]|nr:hypothetical protein [Anaerolineae bacterium]